MVMVDGDDRAGVTVTISAGAYEAGILHISHPSVI